jgi:uncharacterized protein (DUF2236 family)
MSNEGFFGPGSMMWRVNREVFTLFGGARALLMHAAHPLVAAGARQTGGYRRDPWMRLVRTLQLQNLVTFGSQDASQQASDRINKLHKVIHGVDSVTGEWYDALDWEQLLWVHAALEVSTIDFYELAVGPLTAAEKDRYHEENKVAAELLLLPRDIVPATYQDMTVYVDDMIGCGRLRMSDVAQEVADLIIHRVVPARIKPIWHFVAFASVGTLDPRLRELYGFRWTSTQQRWLDMNLAMLRRSLPIIPNRFRTILPARWAEWRVADGDTDPAPIPIPGWRTAGSR